MRSDNLAEVSNPKGVRIRCHTGAGGSVFGSIVFAGPSSHILEEACPDMGNDEEAEPKRETQSTTSKTKISMCSGNMACRARRSIRQSLPRKRRDGHRNWQAPNLFCDIIGHGRISIRFISFCGLPSKGRFKALLEMNTCSPENDFSYLLLLEPSDFVHAMSAHTRIGLTAK